MAMGTQSLPAISREQLYVSLSRGREWARIYTDDRKALGKAVERSDERVSATEVAERRKAKLFHWTRLRRHVAFLQRLTAKDMNRRVPAIVRPQRLMLNGSEIREVAHER